MTLSPMRFKDYVWPHNPRVYEIEFSRQVVSHKIPMGKYSLQNLGRSHRVLRGEGEFSGEGAYEEFRRLGTVFYEETPGILVHPIWQETKAYFVSLALKQEPTADFVSYSFEFWECIDEEERGVRLVSTGGCEEAGAEEFYGGTTQGSSGAGEYTVVQGDCLWSIAERNSLTLSRLLELNPQIKNPNLIYPGDVIHLS